MANDATATLESMLDAGLPQSTIAKALGVSERTVRRRIGELREAQNPTPVEAEDMRPLRDRVLAFLETSMSRDGSIPAAKALLDEVNRKGEVDRYHATRDRTAAAWVRAEAAKLATWIRDRIDGGDFILAKAYRAAATTNATDAQRRDLVEALLQRRYEP